MNNPNIIDLQYRPRTWQRKIDEAFRSGARCVVAVAHRRAGKTVAALMQLVDDALRTMRDGSLFLYVSPFRVQSKAVAWSQLKQILAVLPPTTVTTSESELSVTFAHNGSRIVLAGADNADALRGLRIDGAVVDEVGYIAPEVWFQVLQPALADRSGWTLFIGTPSGIDLLSELFTAAASKPDWRALRFTVHDTGALPPDEVARLQRDMPPTAFAREMLCDFTAAGDDQLMALADVEEASRRRYQRGDFDTAPRIIGVDIARFGNDRSVIFRRQGLQAFTPTVLSGIDNMSVAARVANEIQQWRPDAVFLDIGAGAGVVDRLRQLNHSVVEVAFGGRATRPTLFNNRRSEMWASMAEWIRSGGAIPGDPALRLELATPRYSFDAAGRRCLESKDQIKKRLAASSPDLADALALTFAAPVASTARRPVDLSGVEVRDYFVSGPGTRAFHFIKPRAEPARGEHDPFAYLNDPFLDS